MKTLGDRLRVLRAERRLSQMLVARQAGIAENRYWRIENGYVEPTSDELDDIARAIGVEPHELLPVDDEPVSA